MIYQHFRVTQVNLKAVIQLKLFDPHAGLCAAIR
mgnify:CR=1 FL=1